MKLSEQLKAAKALIEKPENWLQGKYSDKNGIQESTCFCSVGAIHRVLGNGAHAPDRNALTQAVGKVMGTDYTDVTTYNDTHSHAEVMTMWDKAINLLEAEEATQLATF